MLEDSGSRGGRSQNDAQGKTQIIDVADFIAVKGYKAKGKRLTTAAVKEFHWLDPLPEPEPEPEEEASDDEPLTGEDGASVVVGPDGTDDRTGFAEGTQTALF